MARTTTKMLNDKIIYTNEILNTNITKQSYNGLEYLRLNGENIFNGTKRECIAFLNGLVQYQLLSR